MLYPVELRAPKRIVASVAAAGTPDGRGRGIRTPDILLPKQARYQTALYPAINRCTMQRIVRLHARIGDQQPSQTRKVAEAPFPAICQARMG